MDNMSRQSWVVFIEVEPLSTSSILKDSGGAFANAIVYASKSEIPQLIIEALREFDLFLIGLEPAKPFDKAEHRLLLRKERRARIDGVVIFDSFHTYPKSSS